MLGYPWQSQNMIISKFAKRLILYKPALNVLSAPVGLHRPLSAVSALYPYQPLSVPIGPIGPFGPYGLQGQREEDIVKYPEYG